ncbi:hypothetical protein P5_0040 [Aeromonas phage P5]|nr:hypothetical protein P5_0040 [Aeromonas phage P5]
MYSITDRETDSNTETTIRLTVLEGSPCEASAFAIDVPEHEDNIYPEVRVLMAVSSGGQDVEVTTTPTSRGFIVRVSGIHTLVHELLGGNALAFECANPVVTDMTLPSIPSTFLQHITNCMVYEVVLPIGVTNTMQRIDSHKEMAIEINRIGRSIVSMSAPIGLFPIAQVLRSIMILHQFATSNIPVALEHDETLMPSKAMERILSHEVVTSQLAYLDFVTATPNMEQQLYMLDKKANVLIGRKGVTKITALAATPELLAYAVPDVPKHIIPTKQIKKFCELARDYRLYSTAIFSGIARNTNKVRGIYYL